MNVNELLDELRRNILRDVTDGVSADQADLLWTDGALLNYINDAYYRFCQLTEYIQDANTEEVCRIVLEEGKTEYPLSKAVIRVLSVELGNLVLPLNTAHHMLGDREGSPGYGRVRRVDYPGVFAAVPDYEMGALKIVGTPTADDAGKVLRLRVTRYPLERLTLEEDDAVPELPERFHLDLLEWAAFRALRNHDVDAENMAKASAHSTQFARTIDEVKTEMKARKFMRIGFKESWEWN